MSSEADRQSLANSAAASSASWYPWVFCHHTNRICSNLLWRIANYTCSKNFISILCTNNTAESHPNQSVAYVTCIRNPFQRSYVGVRGGKNLLAHFNTVEGFYYVNQPGYPEPNKKKTCFDLLNIREKTVVSKMHYADNVKLEA